VENNNRVCIEVERFPPAMPASDLMSESHRLTDEEVLLRTRRRRRISGMQLKIA